jgi:hypothetical protein
MSTPLVRITCPIHKGVTVARIETAPDGTIELVMWDRDFDYEDTGPGPGEYRVVFDGRRPKPAEEVRVDLFDDHLSHQPPGSLFTWCRKCRSEYELELDRLRDAANRGPAVIACTPHDPSIWPSAVSDVLTSTQEKSPGPEVQ